MTVLLLIVEDDDDVVIKQIDINGKTVDELFLNGNVERVAITEQTEPTGDLLPVDKRVFNLLQRKCTCLLLSSGQ